MVSNQSNGPSQTNPPIEMLFASLDLPQLDDFQTDYEVRQLPQDPHADIGLDLSGDFGGVDMEMTVQIARQIGNDLLEAADEIEAAEPDDEESVNQSKRSSKQIG